MARRNGLYKNHAVTCAVVPHTNKQTIPLPPSRQTITPCQSLAVILHRWCSCFWWWWQGPRGDADSGREALREGQHATMSSAAQCRSRQLALPVGNNVPSERPRWGPSAGGMRCPHPHSASSRGATCATAAVCHTGGVGMRQGHALSMARHVGLVPSLHGRRLPGGLHGRRRLAPPSQAMEEAQGLTLLANDVLFFLGATVIIIPLFKRLKISPVLGFLASGFVLTQLG